MIEASWRPTDSGQHGGRSDRFAVLVTTTEKERCAAAELEHSTVEADAERQRAVERTAAVEECRAEAEERGHCRGQCREARGARAVTHCH